MIPDTESTLPTTTTGFVSIRSYSSKTELGQSASNVPVLRRRSQKSIDCVEQKGKHWKGKTNLKVERTVKLDNSRARKNTNGITGKEKNKKGKGQRQWRAQKRPLDMREINALPSMYGLVGFDEHTPQPHAQQAQGLQQKLGERFNSAKAPRASMRSLFT